MANHTKTEQLLASVALLAPVIVLTLGAWIWTVQTERDLVEQQNLELREILRTRAACTPVQVSCVCPEYEEGWDDAEFAEGCDPAGIAIEDLELICAEFSEYGYIPSC
jgi:hypothetical protein